MIRRDLVVVGAGPAGMAAAVAAAEAGLAPAVIDEAAEAGGQIYRRRPAAFPAEGVVRSGRTEREGAALRRAFEANADRIEHISGASVWGIFEGRRVALDQTSGWEMVDAEALVLATGAHEFVPPFPGWTLPGVMTPGSAQQLAKIQGVRPGQRVLLAGTGPFLLIVARCLLDAGVEVAGIVEAVRTPELAARLPGLLAEPGLVAEGALHLLALRRARVPIHRGCVVVAARGGDCLEAVDFAPCDGEWNPDRSRISTAEVDTLCVGFGFVPRAQLAQLAGCAMRFVPELGGWLPAVDENLETSVPDVWVAGDGGGVAGATAAALEGRLAGYTSEDY